MGSAMTKLKAGVGAVAGALLLAAPAWGIGGASKLDQLRTGVQGTGPAKSIALDVDGRAQAAALLQRRQQPEGHPPIPGGGQCVGGRLRVPARSQTIPSTALQNAVATAAILGG